MLAKRNSKALLDDKKVMRCIYCNNRFSLKDAASLDFFADVHACYWCLKKEQEKPFVQDCFGKFTEYTDGGAVIGYGYDPEGSVECRELCSARKSCVLFATRKIRKM